MGNSFCRTEVGNMVNSNPMRFIGKHHIRAVLSLTHHLNYLFIGKE
jgi:hypothetical protein